MTQGGSYYLFEDLLSASTVVAPVYVISDIFSRTHEAAIGVSVLEMWMPQFLGANDALSKDC